MKSVLYLVKNNIKFKTGAFKGIIALMAIIVFSYSGSVSNSKNLYQSLDESLDHYNVGDILMTFDEGKFDEKIKTGLDKNEHVKSYREQPLLYIQMEYKAGGKEKDYTARFIRQLDELKLFNDDFSGFVDDVPKLKKGEVYVSYCMGKVMGLEKGDTLEVKASPDTTEKFEIKGFTEDPIYGSTLLAPEHFFICDEDYDRIEKGIADGTVNSNYIYKVEMVHIFTDGEVKESKLVKQLNDECGLVDNAMLYITRPELVSMTGMYAETGTSLLYMFVGLLSVVVALMMLNSINSTIEMQYVDLGILKSQGFTLWQIRMSYMWQYVIALVIGTVLGLIISVPLLSVMGKLFRTVTGIHTSCKIDFLSCSLIAVVMIALFMLFVLLSTRKLGKISPVNALNNAHKDVHFTGRLNMPMRQRALSLSMSLRQVTSGFKHYVFVLLISVLLMFFMVTIFNLSLGLNFKEIFGDVDYTASGMLFNEFEEKDMQRVKDRLAELDEGAQADFVAFSDNALADGSLFTVEACEDFSKYYKAINGKICEYDNEVVITKIVADELDKGIGDKVTLEVAGGKGEYLIVGTFQSVSNSGRTIGMTLEGAKKLGMKAQNFNIFMRDKGKTQQAIDTLNSEFKDILKCKDTSAAGDGDIMDLVDMFLVVIILVVVGVSGIFLLVSVSMISKITFLRERTDIGIFKSVGFTVGDLRRQFSLRFLLIGALGSLAGFGLAIAFTNPLLSTLLRFLGITDFTHSLTAVEILVPAAVICTCFALFSFLSSSRIKTVQTTELICE